jgi:hypothetical protein
MDEIPTYSKIIDGLLAVMAGLVIWFTKRLVKQCDDRIADLEESAAGAVSRKDFKEYLEKRDDISETRHNENLRNFKELGMVMSDTRERLCSLEGEITGRRRMP